MMSVQPFFPGAVKAMLPAPPTMALIDTVVSVLIIPFLIHK
jgi:hypothetical protein